MRSWLLIRALLTGLLLTGVLQACAAESAGTEHLIVLRSGDLEVGILADFGGKLVWVSKAGSANFLRENRAHWLPAAWPESVHVNFRRAAFYGTTHWLAPQEHWWQQQDLIPERQGDDWPPDPFLEFGRYQILERTTSAVTIISPPSPVSGVQMKKTFQVMDPEKLRISASIRNQRTDPVHWGLWSNTRFNAGVSFKAALADLQPEHIRYSDHPPFKGVVSQDKQWFTFDNSAKALAVDQATGSKAFLNTQAPLFKVMLADWILYMRPEGELNPASVHPAHATAEVFLMKHPDANQGFLELEFHSQFKTLEPGEELEFAEIWTFSPTP